MRGESQDHKFSMMKKLLGSIKKSDKKGVMLMDMKSAGTLINVVSNYCVIYCKLAKKTPLIFI